MFLAVRDLVEFRGRTRIYGERCQNDSRKSVLCFWIPFTYFRVFQLLCIFFSMFGVFLIMVKRRFNVGSGWYEAMVKNQVVGPNRLVFGSIVKFLSS